MSIYWALTYTYATYYYRFAKKKISEDEIKRAYELFKLAMQMPKSSTVPQYFFSYPNPCSYSAATENEKKLIRIANNIYKFGMCFVLAHEYCHFRLKHSESTPENEYNADSQALVYMSCSNIIENNHNDILLGCISALCTLMFLDNTMEGGKSHPDSDNRIIKFIEELRVSDNSEVWLIAMLYLKMWCWYYQIDDKNTTIEDINKETCYKEFYINLCNQLKNKD